MIPISTLYDEYISRPEEIVWRKQNPFEYIVPTTSRGVGTNTAAPNFFSVESVPLLQNIDKKILE